jgi:tryptophan 2,3-dioxygenase
MTPADYMRFRDSLGQSSGFQSWQYRLLEFMLGNKDARLIEVHCQGQGGPRAPPAGTLDAVVVRRIASVF